MTKTVYPMNWDAMFVFRNQRRFGSSESELLMFSKSLEGGCHGIDWWDRYGVVCESFLENAGPSLLCYHWEGPLNVPPHSNIAIKLI